MNDHNGMWKDLFIEALKFIQFQNNAAVMA